MLIQMKRAQSTLEYALLIGVVVGALLGMQTYLKRSIQGRMQIIGDQMGDQYAPGGTYREENMKVSNDNITEVTSYVGGIPQTRTEISGGYQEMNAIREVEDIGNDEWEQGATE